MFWPTRWILAVRLLNPSRERPRITNVFSVFVAILTTGLGEFLTQEDWDSAKDKDGNYVWKDVKSAECGAATCVVRNPRSLWHVLNLVTGPRRYVIAAFDPSIVPYSGAYLENGDIGEQSRAEHARSEVRCSL